MLKKRGIKKMIFLFLLFSLCTSAIPRASASTSQSVPNLIVILVDDLGYNDLGTYGSPTIATPNMNQLAREGIQFTQFYSAGSLCSPSRAALTGRLPIRTGIYTHLPYPLDNDFRVFYPSSSGCLPSNETTLAEYLRNSPNKYTCAFIGKNHLGHNPDERCLPIHRGFDYLFGLPYSHEEGWPSFPEGLLWPPIPLYKGDSIVEQPVNLSTLTPRYNQEILSLLDSYAESRQPFFLSYNPEQPHIPLFSSPAFVNTSLRGAYGDAIQEMDDSIGQIIQKLKETGLDRNTLVIFASDNGAWVNASNGLPDSPVKPFDGGSNGILSGEKGGTLEGGFRVVSIFWWPGVIQPQISMSVASLMDIVPTFLELIGQPLPNITLDGFSLVPLLMGKNTTSPYPYFYYWRDSVLYAIRAGAYKCHFYTRSGFGSDPPIYHEPCLLYNLEWDPAEKISLNISQYPSIYQGIETEYIRYLDSIWPAPSQLEFQNWTLVPCCQGPVTLSLIQKALHDYGPGLQMWQQLGCTC